ncbi:MAG TPA: gluconate transporter, partial [Sphingobacteriaceae bacterium]|nr:gluconate transporter [Sphingobacteriaceae bacterium]
MALLIVLMGILLLVGLITIGKIHPFLAFLIVSIITGLCLGIHIDVIAKSVSKGVGDTLGSVMIIIILGAMMGKLVAESGAAQKIAEVTIEAFGEKYIKWALMITGFIIGIPIFYNVGFVLMVPLIFSIMYKCKLPPMFIIIPLLAPLSAAHGFLPPHPSPSALVLQLHANMGITLLYGIAISIPAIIIAGPVFAGRLKNFTISPSKMFSAELASDKLPSTGSSILSSLLPVMLLMVTTMIPFFFPMQGSLKSIFIFLSDPAISMLIATIIVTYVLGLRMGRNIKSVMNIYSESAKDVTIVLLIIAGSGALKQVLTDSGVSTEIGRLLTGLAINPLLLGWLIAGVIRNCLGSATVAGLTTAGLFAPIIGQLHVDPNLMVLSIGAGSLLFSHVNDSGFWMFKEYFNISIKETILSWSLMDAIISIVA